MRILPVLALVLVLAGCGPSPILNHADAQAADSHHHHDGHDHGTPQPGATPVLKAADFTFTKAGVSAKLAWRQGPSTKAESAFVVQFTNLANGTPVELDGQLQVELWMPSMGHGSLPVHISPLPSSGPGAYLVNHVFFSMPGDWEVRFTLIKNGVNLDSAAVALKL